MGVDMSHMTISRHLKALGYLKALPKGTPLLTKAHKQKRIEWARQHLNDNWRRTLFSDETVFQLYQNTIEWWFKGVHPIQPCQKIAQRFLHVWILYHRQNKFILLPEDNGCQILRGNPLKTHSGGK
jgi:hypothetical protein